MTEERGEEMQLKSKHLWDITEDMLEPGQTYTDEHGDERGVCNITDNMVAAMLEDLRALEAECERLREKNAKLIAENNDLVNELNGWGKGYDELLVENARLRAMLDEQWTPLESEPGAWANGYEHKMCRRCAE